MKTPNRILVMFPGSLGDFLCFLPALEVIRRNVGGADIILAVRGPAVEMARQLACLSCVYHLESGVFTRLFSTAFGENADEQQFFSMFTHVFTWFGHRNIRVRQNLKRYIGVVHSFPFFTALETSSDREAYGQGQMHACHYYLNCVGGREPACPSLSIPESEQVWLQQYWDRQRWSPLSRILAIHPGSGGQKKRWEPAGFRQVALWWKNVHNGVVLILLGPAEEEEHKRWLDIGIVEHSLSLWRLAAILSRCVLYLGNDSGVSHLAGAVGAWGTVLFGPTRPEQWRPLGGALIPIQNSRYRQMFPHTAGMTLDEICVGDVTTTLSCLRPGPRLQACQKNTGSAI